MNKHKVTYIDSNKTRISLAPALPNRLGQDIDRLIKEKFILFEQEIRQVFERNNDPQIPISVFRSKSSTLEILVKYLHEVENRKFADIALLLQRDPRTIWHAYKRSVNKKVVLSLFTIEKNQITIPLSQFAQRIFSPLEVLVSYLREQYKLSFTEIARLLSLSPKTIWTVYHRYQHKNAPK